MPGKDEIIEVKPLPLSIDDIPSITRPPLLHPVSERTYKRRKAYIPTLVDQVQDQAPVGRARVHSFHRSRPFSQDELVDFKEYLKAEEPKGWPKFLITTNQHATTIYLFTNDYVVMAQKLQERFILRLVNFLKAESGTTGAETITPYEILD